MTLLMKQMEVELINLRDSIISNNDYETELAIKKISEFIEANKNNEDIEYRHYINAEEYFLYNIHTTEDALYAEKYDDIMTEDTEIDVCEMSKCREINVNDVLDLILK